MTSSSAISPADAISLTVAIGTPKCSARPERIGTPALDNCCRVSSWTLPAFTIRSTASVALFILDESPPLAVMALPTFSSTPMACSPSTPAYAREPAASWNALYSIGEPDATRFNPSRVFEAFFASPQRPDSTSCPCCWSIADLTPPTTAAPTAPPTATPAATAPRLAHFPKARVNRFPDLLPDSSACRSVLLKYLLSSSPSLLVLGTKLT